MLLPCRRVITAFPTSQSDRPGRTEVNPTAIAGPPRGESAIRSQRARRASRHRLAPVNPGAVDFSNLSIVPPLSREAGVAEKIREIVE